MRKYYGNKARRGFSLDIHVAKLAMAIERRLWAAHMDYENDVDEWYRSGEGKTKGYAYPACEHGTSRWTDYDNICGPCEDGIYLSNGVVRRQFALAEAKMRNERLARLNATFEDMRRYGVEFDRAAFGKMMAECLDVNAWIPGISNR